MVAGIVAVSCGAKAKVRSQLGTLKVLIAETKPLEEMPALHALSESGTITGKLVATINP